jgi:sigma-E factor negative regulatory protein RseA
MIGILGKEFQARTVVDPLMETHKKIREHISALSDGELSAVDLELALAALQSADGQLAWNSYVRIGDELRARATPVLSDSFDAVLAARLDAEAPPLRRAAPADAAADAAADSAAAAADNAAPPIEAAPSRGGD